MKLSGFIIYLLLVLKDDLTVLSQTRQNVSYTFMDLKLINWFQTNKTVKQSTIAITFKYVSSIKYGDISIF